MLMEVIPPQKIILNSNHLKGHGNPVGKAWALEAKVQDLA